MEVDLISNIEPACPVFHVVTPKELECRKHLWCRPTDALFASRPPQRSEQVQQPLSDRARRIRQAFDDALGGIAIRLTNSPYGACRPAHIRPDLAEHLIHGIRVDEARRSHEGVDSRQFVVCKEIEKGCRAESLSDGRLLP